MIENKRWTRELERNGYAICYSDSRPRPGVAFTRSCRFFLFFFFLLFFLSSFCERDYSNTFERMKRACIGAVRRQFAALRVASLRQTRYVAMVVRWRNRKNLNQPDSVCTEIDTEKRKKKKKKKEGERDV